MSNTAEITLDGKTFSFPVVTGTEGEKAIDITKLRDETGYITLDTGYKNTGATKSAITFLDGELGVTDSLLTSNFASAHSDLYCTLMDSLGGGGTSSS